jgi:hypothetical protein
VLEVTVLEVTVLEVPALEVEVAGIDVEVGGPVVVLTDVVLDDGPVVELVVVTGAPVVGVVVGVVVT